MAFKNKGEERAHKKAYRETHRDQERERRAGAGHRAGQQGHDLDGCDDTAECGIGRAGLRGRARALRAGDEFDAFGGKIRCGAPDAVGAARGLAQQRLASQGSRQGQAGRRAPRAKPALERQTDRSSIGDSGTGSAASGRRR